MVAEKYKSAKEIIKEISSYQKGKKGVTSTHTMSVGQFSLVADSLLKKFGEYYTTFKQPNIAEVCIYTKVWRKKVKKWAVKQ